MGALFGAGGDDGDIIAVIDGACPTDLDIRSGQRGVWCAERDLGFGQFKRVARDDTAAFAQHIAKLIHSRHGWHPKRAFRIVAGQDVIGILRVLGPHRDHGDIVLGRDGVAPLHDNGRPDERRIGLGECHVDIGDFDGLRKRRGFVDVEEIPDLVEPGVRRGREGAG